MAQTPFDKTKVPSTQMLSTAAAFYAQGMGDKVALIQDGDIVTLDAEKGTIDLEVSQEELVRRRNAWNPPKNNYTSGVLWKYAQEVGPARNGAVTHPGASVEVACYADI